MWEKTPQEEIHNTRQIIFSLLSLEVINTNRQMHKSPIWWGAHKMRFSPYMIFTKKNPQPKFLRPKNYAKKVYFATFANTRQKCVIGLKLDKRKESPCFSHFIDYLNTHILSWIAQAVHKFSLCFLKKLLNQEKISTTPVVTNLMYGSHSSLSQLSHIHFWKF